MHTSPDPADVLIVGSGIMGASVAALLRESSPELQLVMVDGGLPVGGTPGQHLHDVEDPVLWDRYNERVQSGIQGMYVGAEVNPEQVESIADATPGMFHAGNLGHDSAEMPLAALSWNLGGMGVHWTAATPWPWGQETFDGGDPEGWQADLDTARRLLSVQSSPLGPTAAGQVVLDVLRDYYAEAAAPGREPQAMPMAIAPRPDGFATRTGPATIFPPIGGSPDDAFELLVGALATRLVVEDGAARGAIVRDVGTGEERELRARTVIVCADAVRTPQLLFASGIRPAALGRYLNEHAFIASRVLMDLDRFGLALGELPRNHEGEFATDSLWIPQSGDAQPFHGQVMNTTYVDDTDAALAYSVGISLYVPIESRAVNRLEFSDDELDVFGMPKVSFRFDYSERDRALIDRAVAEVRELAPRFGPFDPATELAVLPPGSSLHLTGTVRTGEVDDGTSVCDPDGRVWGFENLYLAGTGVIPTPIACNTTLTGTITAVRAARAAALALAGPGREEARVA
ncbi:GMC oxidoreductase [Gryllotalpicola koreensis]|uniref:GMC family oxidoreductase n=1 Tax=Gryllotalpicola koreensis TaxID=993086 RepID=A0ABP8A0X2_9MICO